MTSAPLGKYYDTLPTARHCTGDIWSNLPTHGLLKQSNLPGIVITPACDLANEKVDTISYLPVIPINTYLSSNAFWPEVRGALLKASDQLQLKEVRVLCGDLSAIKQSDVDCVLALVMDQPTDRDKQKTQRKCTAGLTCLKSIIVGASPAVSHADLAELFGQKAFDSMLTRIIVNSYRNDVHYLPSDNQDSSWSIIPCHSLVLFRYPLTVPIEELDLAQSTSAEEWELLLKGYPSTSAFAPFATLARPLKGLRLRIEYLHDLLTRFVCLYTRLGSPDLTESSIKTIKENLRGNAI